MAYSDFSLQDIKVKFKIDNKVETLFKNIRPIPISAALKEDLELATLLPVRSEKAKSELIVMPILIELLKRNERYFTIYSGDTLTADKARGLQGECDFILAKDTGSFDINTPIITVVEAKKHDMLIGIPQCAAQMIGARIYNQTYGNNIAKIYGCVTTGDSWIFLKLEQNTIFIDHQKYYLSKVEEIIGIFQHIIDYYKAHL